MSCLFMPSHFSCIQQSAWKKKHNCFTGIREEQMLEYSPFTKVKQSSPGTPGGQGWPTARFLLMVTPPETAPSGRDAQFIQDAEPPKHRGSKTTWGSTSQRSPWAASSAALAQHPANSWVLVTGWVEPVAPALPRPYPKKGDFAGAKICFQSPGRISCEGWTCQMLGACRQGFLWESAVNTGGQPTNILHCNPHVHCLCSFSCGQYLWCSKTRMGPNTDLW